MGDAARWCPTEDTIAEIAKLAKDGDVVIDGGNSFYKDDIRRAKMLAEQGIHYVDVGTSGGVWGLERGYCMMIGGDKETVDHLDPIFERWHPAGRHRPHARAASPTRSISAPKRAISMPGPPVPATSSR